MSDYTQFIESHNESAVAFLDKQFNQALTFFAKNLASHKWEARKYTQAELKQIMKGEEVETKTKKTKKDDQTKFPKGLTPGKWEKIRDALKDREEDQYVNVKTGKCVKKTARNEDYYFRGNFCAPEELKQVVLWCNKNSSDDDEEIPKKNVKGKKVVVEDEEEDEVEEEEEDEYVVEEEEDEIPKKKGKKVVLEEEDEDDDEDEDDEDEDDEDGDEKPKKKGKSDDLPEGWDQKKLDNLRKKAKEAKANGKWVNAETNRAVAKTDKNKKKFIFTKHGFCVDRANEQLQEKLGELF